MLVLRKLLERVDSWGKSAGKNTILKLDLKLEFPSHHFLESFPLEEFQAHRTCMHSIFYISLLHNLVLISFQWVQSVYSLFTPCQLQRLESAAALEALQLIWRLSSGRIIVLLLWVGWVTQVGILVRRTRAMGAPERNGIEGLKWMWENAREEWS